MKNFLKKILFFLVPILFVALTMEILIRNIPNNYTLKAEYLKEHSNKIETLILGSSHTMYGVNPEYLDSKSFNASNVSQTPDIDLAILKHYEDSLSNLKTVVIRLSYATLFETLGKSDEDWRLKDYNIYFGIDTDYKVAHRFEILSVKLKTNIKRIYDYYFLNIAEQNSNNLGWSTNTNSNYGYPNDMEEIGKIIAKKHTAINYSLFDENVKAINAIIELCNKKNTNVLLITLPAHKAYISNLDTMQLNKTIEFGDSISKKFNNCRYFNFLNNNDFGSDDFYDADHLNEKGAKKFTSIINTLLKAELKQN